MIGFEVFTMNDDTFLDHIHAIRMAIRQLDTARLGLGGPGHGPVFGTPFGPSLGLGPPRSRSGSVLTSVSLDHEYAYLKRDNYINVH